jgi:acetyl esterase/lipase
MDVHVPRAGTPPYPLVVWIHGGAFQRGSRLLEPPPVEPYDLHGRLVARGYAVADVDYRLALEAQYPAQLTDVQAAIGWLRRHAAELGVDPHRFAAMGDSAGGHLAAMAGLLGTEETALQAVVDWYGVVDLSAFGDPDDPSTVEAVLLGGPISGRRDFAVMASPTHRVHRDAPPFLIQHGTADTVVPYAQSEALADALHAHGVRVHLQPVEGAEHCFENAADIGGLIDSVADFLDDVLGGEDLGSTA